MSRTFRALGMVVVAATALSAFGTVTCTSKPREPSSDALAAPEEHKAHGHDAHEPPSTTADAHGPSGGAPVDPHAAHGGGKPASASTPGTLPTGLAPMTLAPEQAAALNLTTAAVAERDFTKTVRTVAVVAPDETRTSHVHAKVRGWIEGLTVNFVGQNVRQGQTLCTIFSQEVFAAELEFVSLLERTPRGASPSGPFADVERRAQDQVVAAARKRLALWDVPRAEIERLERTREPRRTFALSAPRAGTVVAKQALDGMFIDPSVELYLVSDLSRVWVLVDVYEADVPYVRVGDKALIRFAGQDDRGVEAAATFVAPTVDEATRTLKIRFELDNKDGRVRPGTFATAELTLAIGSGLAVPESAVLRTGERAIVFLVHGVHVEPREIRIGPSVDGFYRVEAGLSAGDTVATGAQFLLDSESRLRATSSPGAGHGGH